MASAECLERLGTRYQSARATYEVGLETFAESFHVDSPDVLVGKIKAGELDVYEALDKFLSLLASRVLAPDTIRSWLR